MNKKRLAAAMAAVFAHISTSEEAFAQPVPEDGGRVTEPAAPPVPRQVIQQSNLWGISGRQSHMQANSMMQLRMFK